MAAFGADRLRVMDAGAAEPGLTLAAALAPQRNAIETFADQGGLGLSNQLARLWDELFPLILPPAEDDGFGVAILNSNADTNFSFTNALGMIPVGQARKLMAALDHYPKARWIVGLHHHLIEYPMPVAAFSERIGTALVNGSWFQRVLKPYAERVIGGYYLDIVPDRDALARYGLMVSDVQDTVSWALGGETITTTVEGRERYGVNLRYPRDLRSDPQSIARDVLVAMPGGGTVPLGEVAAVKLTRGPTTIRTENGQLAAYIFVDIRDRDLGGCVAEAATEKVGVEFPARRVGAASEVVVDVNFPRHG